MAEYHRLAEPFQMSRVSDLMRTEAIGKTVLKDYIDMLNEVYEGVPIHNIVGLMAASSEPADPLTGRVVDPEADISTAFQQGGVVGIRAAELLLGTDAVLDLHEGMTVKLPVIRGLPKPERLAALEEWRGKIQVVGSAGYELAEGIQDLVDEWGADTVPDVMNAGYFRRGFGVVIFAADRWRIHRAPNIETEPALAPADDDMWKFFEEQF